VVSKYAELLDDELVKVEFLHFLLPTQIEARDPSGCSVFKQVAALVQVKQPASKAYLFLWISIYTSNLRITSKGKAEGK
jgi:hypothetical protein